MKKIVLIDGQGGRLGALIADALKKESLPIEIYAIGTNTVATTAMLKAGADFGATGENPVIVACRDADVIVGPIGIVCADSLLGEITPNMAHAVGASRAEKLLIPVNRCSIHVAGARTQSLPDAVADAVAILKTLV